MTHDGTHDDCFGCRVKTIHLAVPVFRSHYNWSVGQQVDTSHDLDEALKIRGYEQNTTYQRLDPGDFESITPQSDTEAIELSRRESRDRGLTRPSTTTIMV